MVLDKILKNIFSLPKAIIIWEVFICISENLMHVKLCPPIELSNLRHCFITNKPVHIKTRPYYYYFQAYIESINSLSKMWFKFQKYRLQVNAANVT